MNKELKKKISLIKAIVLDVDGVLTDGVMTYSSDSEFKNFHVRDGKGISMAKVAGLKVFMMTSEETECVIKRSRKLNIKAYTGIRNKLNGIKQLMKEHGLKAQEIAFIGDDLNDIPAMEIVGLPITVKDSVSEVKQLVKLKGGFITFKKGGKGAVREAIEFILKTKGAWNSTVKKDIERQKSEIK